MQALANKKWSPEGQVETRYRKARKEWDDRMGGAVIQARNWRLATLATCGLRRHPRDQARWSVGLAAQSRERSTEVTRALFRGDVCGVQPC